MKEGIFMTLDGKNIGFAMTGSFCTFEKAFIEMKHFREQGANVLPIFSYSVQNIHCRFGTTDDFTKKAWPGLLEDDTKEAQKNVKILIDAMTKDKRFSTIKSEWWHFVDTVNYELHDFDPAKLEKAEAKRDEAISKISQELEDAMVLERDTYPAE